MLFETLNYWEQCRGHSGNIVKIGGISLPVFVCSVRPALNKLIVSGTCVSQVSKQCTPSQNNALQGNPDPSEINKTQNGLTRESIN